MDVKPPLRMSSPQISGGGKGNKAPRLKNGQALWGGEVEVAFIEALQIYPPMGNRRLKCHQLPSGDPSSEPTTGSTILPIKSFGYHQLIQSYIRQKTGHFRSTKQISSHLQRFRNNLHIETPAEREKFSSFHHQDVPGSSNSAAKHQLGTSNLDPQSQGMHLQHHQTISMGRENTGPNTIQPNLQKWNGLYSTTFLVPQFVQPTPKFLFSGEDSRDSPKQNYKPQPRKFGTSMDNLHQSQQQTTSLSMTERRLQSNIPVIHGQLQLPTDGSQFQQFSRVSTPLTWNQYLVLPFCGEGLRTSHDQVPITPMDQILHTPLQPPEIQREDKKKVEDYMLGWRWSPSLDQPTSSSPQEISSSYSSPHDSMHVASSLSPSLAALTKEHHITSSEARFNNRSSLKSLPRKLSYSKTHAITSSPLAYSATMDPFAPTATSDVDSTGSILRSPMVKHEYQILNTSGTPHLTT